MDDVDVEALVVGRGRKEGRKAKVRPVERRKREGKTEKDRGESRRELHGTRKTERERGSERNSFSPRK